MDNNERAPWWRPGLVLFARLSGWIAGPVILGVILGKWLDRKYGTEPWLFLITVGIAFFLSTFGIVRDSVKEMKRIESDAAKAKSDKKEAKEKKDNKKKSQLQNPNVK